MKTTHLSVLVRPLGCVAALLLPGAALAAVSGINNPATSYSTITWNDTNSVNPGGHPGTTVVVQNASPWAGAPNTLPSTTDPFTSDTAQGTISAAVISGNYSLSLSSVALSQPSLNTGFSSLGFDFFVEFQIDNSGLAAQPVVSPTFNINGTVQTGGFASLNGNITYESVDINGVGTVVATATYNNLWNTPGPFSATVAGSATPINTPNLPPNSTLDVFGYLNFEVDPASINVNMVPEPTAGVLLGVGALAGLLWRRRR